VLDRVQGSNLWLTFAIREGKNREVRNVLGHLGLTVTRLIRVSFGPFQLAELALGAVEEVPTRVLREQLGERLIAQSGADFSAPLAAPAARPAPAPRPPLEARAPASAKAKNRKSPHHAWRAHEQDQPSKKLRRKFHGARRNAEPVEHPRGKARESLLTDRKGRPVAVERHGEPPPPHAPREEHKDAFPRPRGRHRSSDRNSGPRPRHPRGRR
jgi:23S rRNA pseudouridine2605 synthase